MMTYHPQYQPPLDWLATQHTSMVATLIDWATINSGSYNLVGIETMRQTLLRAFASLQGEVTEITPQAITEIALNGQEILFTPGKIISIKKRQNAPLKILLCGHMDSVYAQDHPFQQLTWLSDECLQGPAVADMKGGLVVMLYALLALEQSHYATNIGWEVLINADEEIGSQGSAPYLATAATAADIGLVFEPSMTAQGTLAGERKGNGKFTLLAQGRAAHAGRDFAAGRNAICLLAEVITKVNQLNDNDRHVTLNIAKVAGGETLNMVPDFATAQLDIRIKTLQDEAWFLTAMQSLLTQVNQREGYQLTMKGSFGRKPKLLTHETLRLFEMVKLTAKQLALTLEWRDSGGCCDGNNLAAQGLATVDTLGVRGGNLHCSQEYIIIESLVERAQLSALLLMKLASGEIAWRY